MTEKKRNRRRLRRVFIFSLALLALFFLGVPVTLRYVLLTASASDRVKNELQKQVGKSLAEPLAMGGISVDLWGRVVVSDIRLGDEKEPLFKAKKLLVSVKILQLIHDRKNPANIIKRVRIVKPRIHVIRLPEGGYNFDPLIKGSSKMGGRALPQFRISMADGVLLYEDRNVKAPYPIRSVRLDDFHGEVSLRRERVLLVSVDSARSNVGGRVRVNLKYDLRSGWRLESDLRQVPLELAGRFFSIGGYKLEGAVPKLDFYAEAAFTRIGNPPVYSWGGKARIPGARIVSKNGRRNFTDVKADVRFSEKMMAFENLEADFAGGAVRGYGSILDYRNPSFLAKLDFDSLRLGALAAGTSEKIKSPPDGAVSGTAFVSGRKDSIQAAVTFAGKDFIYRGLRFGRFDGQVSYEDGRADVGVSLEGVGGAVEARGAVRTDGGLSSYFAAVDFNGVSLPDLMNAGGVKISEPVEGVVGGNIVLRSDETSGKPEFYGSARGDGVSSYGIENASATVNFRYAGGGLTIENLVAESGPELLIADGTVGADGALDISVDAALGRVSTVLAVAGRADIPGDGALKLSGFIGGTLKEPSFHGDVEGRDVTVSTMSANRVTGSVKYENEVLTLSDFYIHSGKDRHEVDGWIDLEKRNLALDVKVSGASIAGLIGLAKDTFRLETEFPEGLDGIVSARASVGGSFDQPVAEMDVTARDIFIYGETVTGAKLKMSYDKFLKVNEGLLDAAGGVIEVSGIIDPESLDLIFEGKSLRAEKVANAKPYDLKGAFGMFGTIAGSFKSPELGVSFSSEEISFHGTGFKVSDGKLVYRDGGLVELERMTAARGEEKYSFQGSYDLNADSLDMDVSFEKAELNTLSDVLVSAAGLDLAAAKKSKTYEKRPGFRSFKLPEGTNGALRGKCRLKYKGSLEGVISLEGGNLTFGHYPIDGLTFEGAFEGKQIRITEFEAHNEKSIVQASGNVDLEQKASSRLSISAFGIELSRLHDMGLIKIPVGGMADLVVDLIGKEGGQNMAGSIEAYNPSVMNVAFDRARGQFEFDGNVITLKNLLLLLGDESVVVNAALPVYEEFKDKFRVAVSARNLDLSVLNPLLKETGVEIGGRATLDGVRITGNYDSPVFHGGVSLDSASVAHKDLKPPLSDINGKLKLEKNGLTVDSLQGKLGDRDVDFQGGIGFKGLAVDTVELAAADVDNLYLKYKNIYRGKIGLENVGVKYTNDPRQLEITGRGGRTPVVYVHNGIFTIPTFSGKSQAQPDVPIVFGAGNINLKVGENVVVQNAGKNLIMEPSGQITVGGRMSNPELKGWLTATRGQIRLYTATFKIVEEAVIGFNTIKGVGIVPMFYLVGGTRVQGTDVTLYVSGPMIDINQYPAYRELCGVDKPGGEALPGGAVGITVPTMAMGPGGEVIVPVCPRYTFEAYEENDPAAPPLSEQAVLQKLGLVDLVSGGADTAEALRVIGFSAFSPYLGSYIEEGAGLENFTIDLDPNKDVLVKLEKRIKYRFSVRYERLFSQEVKEQLDLRYEFRKRSFLKWGIDQDNQTDYQVEYRLRF